MLDLVENKFRSSVKFYSKITRGATHCFPFDSLGNTLIFFWCQIHYYSCHYRFYDWPYDNLENKQMNLEY